MPIIANQNVYTLTQWANSLGPDHMIQTRVANLLEQQNGVIADAGLIKQRAWATWAKSRSTFPRATTRR